jgi:hypothetical protein
MIMNSIAMASWATIFFLDVRLPMHWFITKHFVNANLIIFGAVHGWISDCYTPSVH